MFGLFGKFGRSRELRQFDQALRAMDLHPALVPEAVKLTMVRLVAAHSRIDPAAAEYGAAAELLAFCMLGRPGFERSNGSAAADALEHRIEAALGGGQSLDAEIVLLAIHAGIIQPSVTAEFGLETSAEKDSD